MMFTHYCRLGLQAITICLYHHASAVISFFSSIHRSIDIYHLWWEHGQKNNLCARTKMRQLHRAQVCHIICDASLNTGTIMPFRLRSALDTANCKLRHLIRAFWTIHVKLIKIDIHTRFGRQHEWVWLMQISGTMLIMFDTVLCQTTAFKDCISWSFFHGKKNPWILISLIDSIYNIFIMPHKRAKASVRKARQQE